MSEHPPMTCAGCKRALDRDHIQRVGDVQVCTYCNRVLRAMPRRTDPRQQHRDEARRHTPEE